MAPPFSRWGFDMTILCTAPSAIPNLPFAACTSFVITPKSTSARLNGSSTGVPGNTWCGMLILSVLTPASVAVKRVMRAFFTVRRCTSKLIWDFSISM